MDDIFKKNNYYKLIGIKIQMFERRVLLLIFKIGNN
jgi:hypothetical protein